MDPHKIEGIYCGAAEIVSAAERQAYLDQACGDDLELRATVERLLEARSKAELSGTPGALGHARRDADHRRPRHDHRPL